LQQRELCVQWELSLLDSALLLCLSDLISHLPLPDLYQGFLAPHTDIQLKMINAISDN
jgi:hypothetical protein